MHMAQTLAIEAIIEKLQAMTITAINNTTIMDESFNNVMLEWVEKIDGIVASLSSCITLNIAQRVEVSIETLKHHTLHVHQMANVMIHKF